MEYYDRLKLELCERIINTAKDVIRLNGGKDINFVPMDVSEISDQMYPGLKLKGGDGSGNK